MSEFKVTSMEAVSFKRFLFQNSANRSILIISGLAIFLEWSIFKYFYPFANFIHDDSFIYIQTAFWNLDINTYLVGYSKFLRLFSAFTDSDFVLVTFQYLLIHASCLFCLFTIFYFFDPPKTVKFILVTFLIANPLPLFLGNLVTSDPFFLSLSFIWFSLVLWLVLKPFKGIIGLIVLFLFLSFIVRYNALIYPFITTVGFGISKLTKRKKLIGILCSFLICAGFVFYTSYKYKKLTGIWQYSPFSGWQLANNAMYAYRYVPNENRIPVPSKFRALDNMIRNYFDNSRDINKHPEEALLASTFYMWDRRLPLYRYRDLQFRNDSITSDFNKWALMGPFYAEYGKFIIKKYPFYYARYYLWPNANKYFAPPAEYLGAYNNGKDTVKEIAKVWFGFKSLRVNTRTSDLKVSVLDYYSIFSGIINGVFLCCILSLGLLKYYFANKRQFAVVALVTSLWLLNAVFMIFATASALRFQSFPIIIMTIFSTLFIDWICKNENLRNEITNEQKEYSQITSLEKQAY